jgi:putative Mn2+ efflux pump MntP
MDLLTTFFIAVGLAMDAFAVSVTSGITIKNCRIRHAVLIASFFGGFQAIMPVVGWLAGLTLRDYIAHIDHWLAFGILGFIGCKMIYESTVLEKTERRCNPLNLHVLAGLSVATSIDALAVGVTFAFLNVTILAPVAVIGIVTFLMSYAGVFIGEKIGSFFEKKIEVAGGAVLILIGLKILLEHLLRHS